MHPKRIIFTVTNDLTYDQRMIRICSSLSGAGYEVLLTGVERKKSVALTDHPYQQKRLKIFFEKGFLFYALYNLRLFFFLLFQKADLICCIDIDTMLPVYLASLIRGKKRVYDAHEFFSQQIEVVRRKRVYRFWHFIEKKCIPAFPDGYTVNESISELFQERFSVNYAVIRNLPYYRPPDSVTPEKKLLYRGAVNEGRCFEQLIPAMKSLDTELHIYGDGNFMSKTLHLIKINQVEERVILHGLVMPEKLNALTGQFYIGFTLFEYKGQNLTFSLANRFFDYIMHGVPQVCMDYPEYRRINQQFRVALLIDRPTEENIVEAVQMLLNDEMLYQELRKNCLEAAKVLNWENEEKKLIGFYKEHLGQAHP